MVHEGPKVPYILRKLAETVSNIFGVFLGFAVAFANLFEVLGINDSSDYTRNGVETAWFELKLAAQNSEDAVHQTQQFAYQYLTSDDAGARTLLDYLLTDPDESTDPSNLSLHRALLILAASARSFSVPDATIGSLLVEHAGATGLEVYRHDSDPYLYALALPEGMRPGDNFVPSYQAGAPLRDGQPRWGLSSRNEGQVHGPQSFLDHFREFAIDIFSFRWLRTGRMKSKFAAILLLVTVIGFIWCGIELFAVRSDTWAVREYAKDIIVTTDNAEQHLRDVRQWFREVQLVGEKEFGWEDWWINKPPSKFSLTLLRSSNSKKEAFKEIRFDAAEIDERINALTTQVDTAAMNSSSTDSKDKVYQTQRTADEITSLLSDLEALSKLLEQYITLQ